MEEKVIVIVKCVAFVFVVGFGFNVYKKCDAYVNNMQVKNNTY